ncbi:MAG: 6-bladed beta-propeller [Saprospiraceae bacterium]
MHRRTFLSQTSTLCAALPFISPLDMSKPIFGHNEKKYTWDKNWLYGNANLPKVKDCHEMVFTGDKDIILLTNDTRNNFIRMSKSGKIKAHYGNEFPGGHGLTIGGVKGDEFLLVTDTDRHQFFKTTLDGKIIKTWNYPRESEKYQNESEFVPTETAVTSNGEIYVADGYGAQYISHYDKDGKLKNVFGGRGLEEKHLDNAHGICIDTRNSTPTLIITDRNRCCFKRFSIDGKYLETISLPGANVCRPVIKGDYLYAAVLTSGSTGNAQTGFVIILDKDNKLISAPGGSTPAYDGKMCKESYQTVQLFKHPHDVLVDDEGSLYVCQWNSGQVLPYKFTPYV